MIICVAFLYLFFFLYSLQLTMALHLVVYGIITTFLIHSSLVHSLNGQVSSSNSSVQQINYVTPNRSMPCLTDRHPCFIIDEYASQIDWFILNNSIFRFLPGNHSLNIGLNISGIHNISFIGLPENSVTIMVFDRSTCISWEDCKNIEITNIKFIIESKFSCVLSFHSTFCAKLSNITILGNGHIGCSSIISEKSVVDISDSTFTGICGCYGAALIASRSEINFAGNNSFLRNYALSGGAVFLYNSAVLFNGTNSFIENSALFVESYIKLRNECFFTKYSNLRTDLSGGAITSYSSTIIILDYSNETFAISDFSFSTFSKCYPVNDSNYEHIDSQMTQMCRIKCDIHQNSNYYCIGETKLPCSCSKLSTKYRIPSLQFYYNSARRFGGSIFSKNSSIKAVCTIIEFVGNSARYDGGALHLGKTSFCFIRSPYLTYAHLNNSLQLSSHILFLNNSAERWGGALLLYYSNCTLYGSISFVSNSAEDGGALYMFRNSSVTSLNVNKHSNQIFTGVYIKFINNVAQLRGGAIFLTFSAMQMYGNVSLIGNCAGYSSGAIFLRYSTLLMCGIISLVENNANSRGGAIYLTDSTIQMCGAVTLAKNKATIGGAVHTVASNLSIGVNCSCTHLWHTKIVFQHNIGTYSGGAVSSIDSRLYFMGSALFDGNTAGYGGAMILDGTSNLLQHPNLTLRLINNRANEKGGVFYFDHSVSSCNRLEKYLNHSYRPLCFVSFEDVSKSQAFKNNSASKAGTLLYSGELGICYGYSGDNSSFEGCMEKIRQSYCSDLHLLFANDSNSNETVQPFSADTKDLKFCQLQHKFSSSKKVSVFPGEKFTVSLIGMGTFNLPVNTSILHKMLSPTDQKVELKQVELPTNVSSLCSNVSYYLLVGSITNQLTVHVKLYHQNPCDSLVDGVNLYINIKPCPIGFELSLEHQKCTCDKWLQTFGITECNIDTLSIERKKNTFWISKLANDSGLILHDERCPFDFCNDNFVNVSLSNPSVQCDFNRNGTLCGQCREQYSLALGTLHCRYCVKSSYVSLVLPFALAGIALVIVIFLLHLTVDVGTLNGLIFYANIVHSNGVAYFRHTREIANFHAIFISWLNLDFGFETCFYDGMDIYAYSWLQFLFPFYLWFLISAIIFICRYSQRVSRSLGRNPVAALGTVLFLSYGKVLNAIIVPLFKTKLVLKSSYKYVSTHSVWLYDGSVEYFTEPKHSALGIFAILILLIAFAPYTFILLCGHRLMAYSNKCFLSWLNKIKPFMDVYYAPFRQEARYWIGLTLLARSALLLTIAINAVGSDSVNLLVITSVSAGLLSIKGRVYKYKCNDILESSFILNLCVLSVATFYLKDKGIESQPAILINASVGISFVMFIGIIFFHIHLLFKSKNVWNYVFNSLLRNNWLLCKAFKMVPKEDESMALESNVPEVVSSTLVELREPLIDNDDL